MDYKPKSVRAREAVEANPEKSDRAIAKDIGVSKNTVRTARNELVSTDQLDRKARERLSTRGQLDEIQRIGLDGKKRRLGGNWGQVPS
jgi:hypothetical protein